MKKSNYERQAELARTIFLKTPFEEIRNCRSLQKEGEWYILHSLNDTYRIRPNDARIEKIVYAQYQAADPVDVLALTDLLCYSREPVGQLGEKTATKSLPGLMKSGMTKLGDNYRRDAREFELKRERFEEKILSLGGTVTSNEASLSFPIYESVMLMMRFFFSDEDFPAEIVFFWPKHIQRILHYETLWYFERMFLDKLKTQN